MAKPEPAIYRYVLDKLGTAPEETLFLDDRQVNVDAARALGIKGLVFTNVDRLRADLIAQGLDRTSTAPSAINRLLASWVALCVPQLYVFFPVRLNAREGLSLLLPAFTTPCPAPPGSPPQ